MLYGSLTWGQQLLSRRCILTCCFSPTCPPPNVPPLPKPMKKSVRRGSPRVLRSPKGRDPWTRGHASADGFWKQSGDSLSLRS